MNNTIPIICDIKQNSLDDGPGIRTVLFFKGCPLACAWCQNPEAQDCQQQIAFQRDKCIKCSECIPCQADAITYPPVEISRELCNLCTACVDACPAGVFKLAGKFHEVSEIVALARENKTFYTNSGGGLTLSGGEPLIFPEYVLDVVEQVNADGIGVVLETCGHVKLTPTVKRILASVQLIYYDVKIMDVALHEQYTGASNALILQNLEEIIRDEIVMLPESKEMLDFKTRNPDKPLLVPRIPLVPGITATPENLKATASFFHSLGIRLIDVLPYNPLWIKKAETLGMPINYGVTTWMDKAQLAMVRETLKGFKFDRFK
ncbi:MAG TPA: glycyl-radical enzyme activating protein [Candidatus Lokiarchaeia archaeon]|nr:glycyl-radical enzyme activating protein [Candidatus Lokiarchaeia archaeon]